MTTKEAISVLKEEGRIFSITNKRLYEAIQKGIKALEQEKNGWIRADIHPDANPVIAKVAGECCSFRILRWVDSKVAGPGYFVVTKEGYMIGPYDVEEWRYIF